MFPKKIPNTVTNLLYSQVALPNYNPYSSVLSRESVYTIFMMVFVMTQQRHKLTTYCVSADTPLSQIEAMCVCMYVFVYTYIPRFKYLVSEAVLTEAITY